MLCFNKRHAPGLDNEVNLKGQSAAKIATLKACFTAWFK